MTETTGPTPTAFAGGVDAAQQRSCTRCDGQQHLVAEGDGMGKYRCDTCGLIVGFDLDAARPEFLIDRGLPRRYTKKVFGNDLQETERRLS